MIENKEENNDLDIEKIEIDKFKANINYQIQRLCLEKEEVIKIIESLYI